MNSTVICQQDPEKVYDIVICGGAYTDESVKDYLAPGTYLEKTTIAQTKTVFQVKYKPTLDMPKNVAVLYKGVKNIFKWDGITDECLDHYELRAIWKKDGIEVESEKISVASDAETQYDFTEFINDNGEGKYYFSVKCVAKPDSEKYDSSGYQVIQEIYAVNIKQRIKDEDSTAIGMAGKLTCTVKDGGFKEEYYNGEVNNDTPTMYFPVNSRVTLKAIPDTEHAFYEFKF